MFITQAGLENSSAKYFPIDTVLVAMYGATAAQVGILKIKATSNQAVCGILPNDHFIPEFVYYWFKLIESDLASQAQGGAQPNISQEKIKKVDFPIISFVEQERIVERLDAAFAQIDELKSNAERQLAEARALFQSTLTQAMQPKQGWQEKTLGDIAIDMYRGSGIRRDQITKEGFPCVRYGEIYTTYNISFEDCVSHTLESSIVSPKYFEHGDLLFAITGESVEDIGKTIAYMGNEKCLLGGDIICMKHKQNPKFLSYALSTTDAIRQKGFGKTKLKVVHTNAPSLRAIRIPLPPLSEQQSIVEHLDSISTNIRILEEINQKIKPECDAIKQALLRQIFE
jgi:type I restriction enzyme S subunit